MFCIFLDLQHSLLFLAQHFSQSFLVMMTMVRVHLTIHIVDLE